MKTWVRKLTVLSFLMAIIVAGGVCNSQAADFDRGFGHRFGADLKLVSSLNLSADEQAALKIALSSYGPAVRVARQQLHAATKQLRTDLNAASPDGATLAADASAVSAAKAQLKGARAQLNSAVLAALTPEHVQQLQAELMARFQSRLDARTGRLLTGYARTLEKP